MSMHHKYIKKKRSMIYASVSLSRHSATAELSVHQGITGEWNEHVNFESLQDMSFSLFRSLFEV